MAEHGEWIEILRAIAGAELQRLPIHRPVIFARLFGASQRRVFRSEVVFSSEPELLGSAIVWGIARV